MCELGRKHVHTEYGSPSGVDDAPFPWELIKNKILEIKDMK